MKFAQKLRILRKQNKWSQDELGQKVGIHGRHVGKYENGQVMPNAETLIKIADVFDVSIDYLLRNIVDPNPDQIQDKELLKFLDDLSKMDEKDKEVVKSLIDAYLKKRKVETVMSN